MFVVFENGGKQYKAKKDDVLKLEKFDCKKNDIINDSYKKAEYFINLASNSLSVFEETEEKNIISREALKLIINNEVKKNKEIIVSLITPRVEKI